MTIIFRLITGFIGAIMGVFTTLFFDLTIGDGLQLLPLLNFVIPLVIGAIIGFILGFCFHEKLRKLLKFLGYFSLESS